MGMEGWLIASVVAGFLCGAGLVYLVMQGRLKSVAEQAEGQTESVRALLQQQLESAESQLHTSLLKLETTESEVKSLVSDKAHLESTLEQEARHNQETIVHLKEAKEALRMEFQNLANEIFDEKSKKFGAQNLDSLKGLLNPFQTQIKDFEKRVDEVYNHEARERHLLKNELQSLKNLNERLSEDALNLTKALKGQSKTQGDWGEIVLERVLEESGLHKGREYETQGTFRDEQGNMLRPDVVVHLPEGKDIVVDSKVSLVAYENYVNAETEELKAIALKQHLDSLNKHLKELSDKSYGDLPGLQSLDFVLMFIPIEGAYFLALDNDRDLFRKGFEKNIMLVSPSTLLLSLRTIQNIWRYEYQSKNALEIARKAGGLYDKFVNFAESLNGVRTHLDKARDSHDEAVKRLSTGKGNIIRRVEELKSLGAKTEKSLPEEILDQADALQLSEDEGDESS
jgi:DNA recombination protein RmuC